MKQTSARLSASLICANPVRMEDDLNDLLAASIDLIHFDVMDGSFVPRFGLYPELLAQLRHITDIPVDVHMMVEKPEDYVTAFAVAGATYFCFHAETSRHASRVIRRVTDEGMKPGIAINPSTPIASLDAIIEEVEMVVLMAINPGIVGQKMIPAALDRIAEVRDLAVKKGNENVIIEIDGGVTFDSGRMMVERGADVLVCGTGTIFRPKEDSIKNKIRQFRETLR